MAKFNCGKSSMLVRLWNKHRSIDEVAHRTGIDDYKIIAYLSKRPGYPGPIVPLKEQPPKSIQIMQQERSAAVTLPRVRFLEHRLDFEKMN